MSALQLSDITCSNCRSTTQSRHIAGICPTDGERGEGGNIWFGAGAVCTGPVYASFLLHRIKGEGVIAFIEEYRYLISWFLIMNFIGFTFLAAEWIAFGKSKKDKFMFRCGIAVAVAATALLALGLCI